MEFRKVAPRRRKFEYFSSVKKLSTSDLIIKHCTMETLEVSFIQLFIKANRQCRFTDHRSIGDSSQGQTANWFQAWDYIDCVKITQIFSTAEIKQILDENHSDESQPSSVRYCNLNFISRTSKKNEICSEALSRGTRRSQTGLVPVSFVTLFGIILSCHFNL